MRPGAEITGAWRAAVAELRLEFAGRWRPWLSDSGRLWATRLGTGRRRPEDAPAAWSMTIDADTPGELRAAILAQESAGSG